MSKLTQILVQPCAFHLAAASSSRSQSKTATSGRVLSAKGVKLAQKMQVGACIHVGILVQKAEVGPTSGPTWCLSHFVQLAPRAVERRARRRRRRPAAPRRVASLLEVWGKARAGELPRSPRTSEKDAKLAQKLGQLQPFIVVCPQSCMDQSSSSSWADLTPFSRENTL